MYHLLCSKLQFTLRWGNNNTWGRRCTSVSADPWLGAKSWHLTCLVISSKHHLAHVCKHTHTHSLPCTLHLLIVHSRLYKQSDAIHSILQVYFKIISVELSCCTGGQLFPRWNWGEGLWISLSLSVYQLNAVDWILMKICGMMHTCSGIF